MTGFRSVIRKYRFCVKSTVTLRLQCFYILFAKVTRKTAAGIIKARFFDEVQGKKAKNPYGF